MLLSKKWKRAKQGGNFYQFQKDQEKILYKCFNILNIYFWIHSIGLPNESKSNSKRRFQIFISNILAVTFEGNVIYNVIKRRQYLYDNDVHLKNSFIIIGFVSLSIMQRYSLYSSSRKLFEIFVRSVKLSSIIQGKLTKRLIVKLLIVLIITDIFIVLGLIPLFYVFQLPPVLINNNEVVNRIFLDSNWPIVTFFFIFWKNTSMCITFYFGIICYILKQVLVRLATIVKRPVIKTEYLIKIFNEILDIAKETNEVFCSMILTSFAITLGGIFFQLYNILFNPVGLLSIYLFRISCIIWYFLPFLLACFLASSVSNSTLNVKYLIKKIRIGDFKSNPFLNIVMNKDPLQFTILDSIVIDKSLIFSAGGVLLSYGTLIATFQISSKQQ